VGNLVYLLRREELPDEERREYLKLVEQELQRVAVIARRTLGLDCVRTRSRIREESEGPCHLTVREEAA
jgi:hypothetical protein